MTTLVIAAHPDDEVLGCGAYMARLAAAGENVLTVFVSDGESSRFNNGEIETQRVQQLINRRRQQAIAASKIMGTMEPRFLDFADNRLDRVARLDITKALENIILAFQPVRVLTHHWSDLNIDHQILSEVVQVIARPQEGNSIKELLFFELPSSTEWRAGGSSCFTPSVFVNVENYVSQKLEALGAYDSELRPFPHPRSHEAIQALLKWRGASSGFSYAEAFAMGRTRIS